MAAKKAPAKPAEPPVDALDAQLFEMLLAAGGVEESAPAAPARSSPEAAPPKAKGSWTAKPK